VKLGGEGPVGVSSCGRENLRISASIPGFDTSKADRQAFGKRRLQ